MSERLSQGLDFTENIRDFSFVCDDYECPFYGLREEIDQIPDDHSEGVFEVRSDERLHELLSRITVVCVACLKDAMKGLPLPER
ncbi:hypothetical protein [Caldimonas brevitalea]|uniref:hypothetical protein n=1 Tax=Caldimonas brevitalea TaxID=413882 RepID=UPI00146FFD5A|nr:hypothetical protein [Caldimonas brevitalea]